MSVSLGTVVVAGRSYEVLRLRLICGQLHVVAYGRGPSPAVRDEPATVFGEDGRGVCQSWHVSIPSLGPHDDVTIVLPVQFTHLEVLEPR